VTRALALLQLAASLALVLLALGRARAEVPPPVAGRILKLSARLDRLVAPHAQLEKIADGFTWVEGPAWNRAQGFLVFSDIPRNAVYRWRPGLGVDLFLQPSGYSGSAPFEGREPGSNGLAWDPEGRLLLCEHGDRRLSRLETDGRKVTLVDRYQGKRINSPNDVLVAQNGDLYFTDPPFGLPGTFTDPRRELDFAGVYRLSKAGELTLLTRELYAPNGLALSPDGKTLYVSVARPLEERRWVAFDVREDGTLGKSRIFYDAAPWTRDRKGDPDGIKVDRDGNLFAAGPGGVFVFAPDGTLLGLIETGVATSNVAWGDDGSLLYVTASTAIYRIRTRTKGLGLW
jgi:gluconolactonase